MSILLILFIYFLLGGITGLCAGLLGIGGGIIVVPALAYIFHHDHMPAMYVMHLAVGTSLAIMVSTTLRSLKSHLAHQGRGEFWGIAKLFMPTVIVGVVGGAFLADYLHSNVLRMIFGIALLLIAIRILFFSRPPKKTRVLPANIKMRSAGLIMGILSGLLGIGGGTTAVPYLLYYQVSMRTAVRVAIFVGLLVAIVGAIAYGIAGINEPLPAHCWGYIYWPAWLGTSVGSVLFAPFGVRLSYFLPTDTLKRLFALLMVLISIHMLFFK
ncbi:MAG: hypothetical protein COB66_02050 [Coxiella sp. (in: Bacteria)]|nr:MAG: hypothetical protein COB66_02050 [Coxiella sp. (in: g-proteobacteria)]